MKRVLCACASLSLFGLGVGTGQISTGGGGGAGGGGTVNSVNGVTPGTNGNVTIAPSNIGAFPADNTTVLPVTQVPVVPAATKVSGLAPIATSGSINDITAGLLPLNYMQGSAAVPWTDTLGGLPFATPTSSTTTGSFFAVVPAPRSGFVDRVSVVVDSSGTFKLKTYQDVGNLNVNVVASATVTVVAGYNQLVAGRDFPATALPLPAGGYLGFTDTNSAHVRYFLSGSQQQYGTLQAADPNVNTTSPFINSGQATYLATWDVRSNAQSAAMEHVSSFSAIPVGWQGNFGLNGSGAAYSNIGQASLQTNLLSGIDRRTLTWNFQMNSGNTIAGPATKPGEQSVNWGSYVRVNMTTNAIEIMTTYTGSNTPNVLQSYPVPWTLAINHTYQLIWKKLGSYRFSVTLTDLANGQSVTADRTGYLGYANYTQSTSPNSDQGGMQGAPFWFNFTGSTTVFNYDQHLDGSPSPTLFIIGDSITEGLGIKQEIQRYAYLLRNTLGTNQVVASGISGATAAGSLPRVKAELTYLRPRNVLIFLGTNSESNFASGVQALVDAARAAGANVGVCTVPGSAANTNTVRALVGVRVVDFAAALTTSGPGTQNPADYVNTDQSGNTYNDNTHPNAVGNVQMANRVLIDWPELAW